MVGTNESVDANQCVGAIEHAVDASECVGTNEHRYNRERVGKNNKGVHLNGSVYAI